MLPRLSVTAGTLSERTKMSSPYTNARYLVRRSCAVEHTTCDPRSSISSSTAAPPRRAPARGDMAGEVGRAPSTTRRPPAQGERDGAVCYLLGIMVPTRDEFEELRAATRREHVRAFAAVEEQVRF